MTAPAEPLLTCDNLLIGYAQPILPALSITIQPGQLWAVVGPNGAGKSTWMRTALGLQSAVGGGLHWGRGVRAAYVPQAAALDPIYPVRVKDLVEMGLLRRGRFFGFARSDDRRKVEEALRRVNAFDLIDHPFRDLSGGQRQRVLIARALATGAQMYFFDEPTSALDRQSEQAVLSIIDSIRRTPGNAVALITHHLQVLRTTADHALLLDRDRQIAVAGPSHEVMRSKGFIELFGDASQIPVSGHP